MCQISSSYPIFNPYPTRIYIRIEGTAFPDLLLVTLVAAVARLKSLSVCNTALGLYATSALSHLPGIDSRRKHTQRLTGWATLDTGLLTVCFRLEVSRNLAPY